MKSISFCAVEIQHRLFRHSVLWNLEGQRWLQPLYQSQCIGIFITDQLDQLLHKILYRSTRNSYNALMLVCIELILGYVFKKITYRHVLYLTPMAAEKT